MPQHMKFPVIRVRDKSNGRVHIVGSDVHDTLRVHIYGGLQYSNLQNCEGTGIDGEYEFADCEIEFVSFEEIVRMYERQGGGAYGNG